MKAVKVLFLTMGQFDSIEAHSIYADLLRCFRNHGHEVYIIAPNEHRTGKKLGFAHEKGAYILHVVTGDVTGTSNLIKKGIAQISVGAIYIKAIKKYYKNVKFDLVIYSTPPITFFKVVEFIKSRDGARTYLLLKDIFPQNAADIGLMSTTGVKGILYKRFRKQEKKLYAISDRIGCMSPANVEYIIKHNQEVTPEKVEVCPNSIEVLDRSVNDEKRKKIREQYDIPLDKKIFIYGGNLGKPQGIAFVIECLKAVKDLKNTYFVIVGDGSEYGKLEQYTNRSAQTNLKLLKRLPKEDYDMIVGACDVGMIFLDYRFTIPNFPSRILSYMQARLPVLAVTDPNTDIGKIIVDGKFGWWCKSNDVNKFAKIVNEITNESLDLYKINAWKYLHDFYDVKIAFNIISSE